MSVWVDRTLSQCAYYIGLCVTEKLFHKELKAMGIPERMWPDFLDNDHCNATLHSFVHKDKNVACIVCIPHDPERCTIQIAGLLVHEATHIWQWHCEHIKETYPAKEQEAYAIQSISQGLMMAYAAQVYGKVWK